MYSRPMTKLLEKAITEVRKLPAARQDEAAEMLLAIASQDGDDRRLSDDQIADLERRLGEPIDIASDAEVEAVLRRLLR